MLDAGIAYTNNQSGKSAWQQGSGLLSNTVFGLSGNEDLGGGLHALFRLENGFNLNNGTQSTGTRCSAAAPTSACRATGTVR
jgi:predicted porin